MPEPRVLFKKFAVRMFVPEIEIEDKHFDAIDKTNQEFAGAVKICVENMLKKFSTSFVQFEITDDLD